MNYVLKQAGVGLWCAFLFVFNNFHPVSLHEGPWTSVAVPENSKTAFLFPRHFLPRTEISQLRICRFGRRSVGTPFKLRTWMQSEHPNSASEELPALDNEEPTSAAPQQSHMGKKTVGVDYGLRRTGVCVSVGYAPRPLPIVMHDNNASFVAASVATIVKQEGAEQVVVGLPLNAQGEEGEQAKCTRDFVTSLAASAPHCRIYLWDERFSSAVAKEKLREMGYHERELKGTGMVDVVAAIGILSDFFDKNGAGALLAYDPPAGSATVAVEAPKQSMPTKSFKEWRKEAMMQAAAAPAPGGKRGKKKKRRK